MRTATAARLAAAAAVLCTAFGMGAVAPASACACGGVVSPGDTARVDQETAVLAWDGRRETILMRLALTAESEHAALIVPTPRPATVTAGSPDTFAELSRLTAPEFVVETEWFADAADGSGAPAAVAPTVLDQVRLGPLEATTLSGGDLTGLRTWLGANGYALRPEVTATLAPYVREGWSFVAMRLTGAQPLDGALDPVRLSFDSDRLVYPMRMSAAARTPQSVHLYVLDRHRVARADDDAAHHYSSVEFAGRVDPADVADPLLRELTAAGQDYLTEMQVHIADPATVTTDFTFTAAPEDADYRRRFVQTDEVMLFGLPAGYVVLGAAGLAAAVVVIAVVRVARARPGA
ncbi:DUF2330 domain-containing protein [Nocardia farcinica]|uniref:DUF2330 domain-containing protein n=1 Tax=Nocardia farcinica TaxID=37329 RepID=UPI002458373F|nr:DUF2330 domain-containing protein [Nocardia farcinica]